MKKILIFIFVLIIIQGCKNPIESVLNLITLKKQFDEFMFDPSKLSDKIEYVYRYDTSGKLTSQTDKISTYLHGQIVDSMTIKRDYYYNNKGLLTKKLSKADFEEKASKEIFGYNSQDSLILKMDIDEIGDTTFWEKYEYFPDGRKTVYHRFLTINMDPDRPPPKSREEVKYDTVAYRNEFIYAGKLCTTMNRYNLSDNIIKIINYEYEKDNLSKEMHWTFYDDLKYLEKNKYYDYSKSEKHPDYHTINSFNDTIEHCINKFDSNELIKTTNIWPKLLMEEYYKNGKLIGTVEYRKEQSIKVKYDYDYYENGRLKLERSSREPINAH